MLVTRTGLSPVMVGRDSELEQLRRLAVATAAPTIALIGGEAGIGKTRLASELITLVTSARPETTLLLGQADPGGLGQPYQLLLDLAGDRPELTAALQEPGRGPVERGRAALELLRSLVGTGPALLVVDDLHSADQESLLVFDQLDEVSAGPLLLLGTYRPEALSRRHPLAGVLERLDRRRGVTHLRLDRLTPADTGRFLTAVYGRAPASRVVTDLHHRTGGNPFFLEELLKAAGDTDLDRIHTLPLPWNLAEALRSQLDGLSPEPRQVMEAAAVLGGRVPFDLLATVTGLDESTLITALRELVDRGLLVEAEDDQFGFRHALTREAIAGELLGRERRRLHEAALEALLASPDPDLARVAKHARGAGRHQEMIDAARRGAAERLAAGSAYGALVLAELALAEVPDDAELLALAATAAWRPGYLADAERYATRALRVATDDAGRVAALIQMIRIAWEQRTLSDMDNYAERVRELTDRLPDGEVRARAMAAVAQAYMLRNNEPGDSVEWADRACEVAERHGLKGVRLLALVEKGSALVQRPDTAEAGRRLLVEVATEAEHAGAHVEAARSWHNLFWCAPPGDTSTPELLERMRASAERAGLAGTAFTAYHDGLARLAHSNGDLDGAIAVLEQARRLEPSVTAVDPAIGAPIAMHVGVHKSKHIYSHLVELYVERGDLDAAEALLGEATAAGKLKQAAVGLAFQVACHRGEFGRARELLAELTAHPDEPASSSSRHCELAAGLAAGLPLDRLRPLVEPSTARPHPLSQPLWSMLEAQVAEAQERYEEALAGYETLIGSTERGVPRCETVAKAHLGTAAVGAARCLIQLGRLDEARSQVAAAQRDLARWSGWRRAELAVVARRLGPVARTSETILTPRERDVATLLVEGLTNSEIARRLVISRKTVAVHVSHILAKLEMSSRTQVAAWVAKDGLN